MITRILFINHTSDSVGGAEDDFERLLRYFSLEKEKYLIDGLFPKGPRSAQFSSYCNKSFYYKWGIYPVIYDKFKSYIYYLIKSFVQLYTFHKSFKNSKYDICLINVSVLLWPALYFKFKGSKIIFFIRETIYPDISRKIYYKLISRLGDFFFSVSERLMKDFTSITGSSNIRVIFSAIEDECLNNNHLSISDYLSEEKCSRVISDDGFKFLNVGMINKRKNQIMILKALNILNKRLISVKPIVFFVGKFGNEPGFVNEFNDFINQNDYLREQLVFLGELKREIYYKIARYMNSYVISSLSEGMPIVLVEAIKLKIPVISTKVGGIEDIIKDKETGILIDLDENSLADAMEILITNPQLAKKISDNANEIYRFKFNLKKNLSIIDNIVETLTG